MRRERETPEYAAMVERMVRAYGRRVGSGDYPDLARMLEVRAVFDAAIADAVTGQRAAGFSWSMIAIGLGVTRQSAQERYGKGSRRLAG